MDEKSLHVVHVLNDHRWKKILIKSLFESMKKHQLSIHVASENIGINKCVQQIFSRKCLLEGSVIINDATNDGTFGQA